MHYKNGRAAKEGDPVIAETYKDSGQFIAGKLHSTSAQSTTCNGQISFSVMGGTSNQCVTVGEIYHAEDAFAAIEAAQKKPELNQ